MAVKPQKNKNALNLFLNTYFNIFMVFVVLLVLFFSYTLIIRPKYDDTMVAIKTNLEKQQRLYTEQSKKLNSLKIVADLYKKIPSADLDKFNGVLPDNYVKEVLFGELGEIIGENGFILNSVTINDPLAVKAQPGTPEVAPQAGKVGKLNLQLAISAVDYAGFKNLLKLLESNLRLFDITSVNFSPGGNSADIMLTTYYYNK